MLWFFFGVAFTYIMLKLVIPSIPESLKKKVNENFSTFMLVVIVMSGIMLFLFLPLAFKHIAINVWEIPTSLVDENGVSRPLQLLDLGPLGDIYGSLNTLFTSITLGLVAYTAELQRKANKHTYNSNQIQINEAKYSNFSNLFYSLLNHKQAKVNSLIAENQGVTYDSNKIFLELTKELANLCAGKWKNLDNVKKEEVNQNIIDFSNKTFGKLFHAQIHSYFLVYSDLLNLINRSEISKENKDFFKRLLSNSMSGPEQISLLWISSYREDINQSLNDSEIFRLFYSDNMLPFAKKFHAKSHFSNIKFLKEWDYSN